MSLRLGLVRGWLGLANLARFLAPALLRPGDYRRLSVRLYESQTAQWGTRQVLARGLEPWIARRLPVDGRGRRALVLGSGGGREAIPLARRGWLVTGPRPEPADDRAGAPQLRRGRVAAEWACANALVGELPAGPFHLVLAPATSTASCSGAASASRSCGGSPRPSSPKGRSGSRRSPATAPPPRRWPSRAAAPSPGSAAATATSRRATTSATSMKWPTSSPASPRSRGRRPRPLQGRLVGAGGGGGVEPPFRARAEVREGRGGLRLSRRAA